MVHNLLIGLHTAGGLLAVALGLAVILQALPTAARLAPWYLGTLWLMVLALVAVVTLDWPGTTPGSLVLLALLAVYVGWRGLRATRQLRAWRVRQPRGYVEDIGFTVIALLAGFGIVLALDLGVAAWLAAVIAVLAIVAGHYGLEQLKSRRGGPPLPEAGW